MSNSAEQSRLVQRQFVSFVTYQLDPSFRRLPGPEKHAAKVEFIERMTPRRDNLICLSYSTVGLKTDADLLFWRISTDPSAIQAHTAAINQTLLGGYLRQTNALLSMTKRSQYVDKIDPFHDPDSRAFIVPGRRRYLFVYPFVKTRQWYLLPLERRQQIMDVHIKVGNQYPSIKLNTTYSFGLDDQDFVVAFETDEPKDFLDLVMALRETESSLYTVRDTPIFTAIQTPLETLLEQLA